MTRQTYLVCEIHGFIVPRVHLNLNLQSILSTLLFESVTFIVLDVRLGYSSFSETLHFANHKNVIECLLLRDIVCVSLSG